MSRTFLTDIAPTFPRRAGYLSATIFLLTLQTFLLTLIMVFWDQLGGKKEKDTAIMLWFFYSSYLCVPMAYVILIFVANWRTRRWCRNVLVPRAEVEGIGFDSLLDCLDNPNSDYNKAPNLRVLVRKSGVLYRYLEKLGKVE